MREILFRGKQKDNGEWVEGSLVLVTGKCAKIMYNVDVWAEIIFYTVDNKGFVTSHRCAVDPETVGQYTGVTDKNGKKVFEGDIVEFRYQLKKGGYKPFRAEVKAERESFGAYNSVYGFCAYLEFGDIENSEVVGNIHDNPEPPQTNGTI